MARAMGARSQLALAFESVYGTAPASGYTQMSFASSTLGGAQPLIDSELLGQGRDPVAPIKDAVTVDGDIVLPIDTDGIGFWLRAAFGAPTTTGTAPKTHTFQSGNWTLPSLALEVGMPEVPHFAMYSGLRVGELAFNMQRKGNLQVTAKLIGQSESIVAATAAGTLAQLASLARFGHFNGAIKKDAVTLANITSADFTYSNGLDPVETIRADGKIDGADPGMASLKGSITSRFADQTLINQALAGTPSVLEFSWTISASLSLKLEAHAVYLPKPRVEISGPGGVQAVFDWQAAKAVSPARMCTFTLVNAVAAY